MDKDSKGQRKSEDSSGGLFHAVERQPRIEQNSRIGVINLSPLETTPNFILITWEAFCFPLSLLPSMQVKATENGKDQWHLRAW